MDVSHTIRNNTVKIFISGILHIYFRREHLRGLQSWQFGKDQFVIEVKLKDATLTLEYDQREKWTAILTALDTCLP
jgi:hypothetical protein